MDEIKKQVDKLKEFGLSDNKIYALIILAQEEFLDNMEDDLLESNDQELQTLADELSNIDIQNIDEKDSSNLLNTTLKRIYGMSVESKIHSFIAEYLANCVDDAQKVKDFLNKYNQGDIESIQKVLDAQNDPDYKDMEEALKTAQEI